MKNFILDIAFTIIAKLALTIIDIIYFAFSIKDKIKLKSKSNHIEFVDYKFNYENY